MDYGLFSVLGGAALACAVVIHLWLMARRQRRRIEQRIAGLRDEYGEED